MELTIHHQRRSMLWPDLTWHCCVAGQSSSDLRLSQTELLAGLVSDPYLPLPPPPRLQLLRQHPHLLLEGWKVQVRKQRIYQIKDQLSRKVLLHLLRVKRRNRRVPIAGRDISNIEATGERDSHSLSERSERPSQVLMRNTSVF